MSDGPYVPPDIAETILETAFPSIEHNICPKTAASHACAVAAAGIAARDIQATVRYLRDQVAVRHEEMAGEQIFTKKGLRDHLNEIRRIVACMSCLVGHIAGYCYSFLPEAEAVREEIVRAQYFVVKNAIDPIEAFLHSRLSWFRRRKKVRELICGRCTAVMAVVLIHPMLLEAEGQARGIAVKVQSDWEDDLTAIAEDPDCQGPP